MPMQRFPRSNGEDLVVIQGSVWDRLCETVESLANAGYAPPLMLNEGPWGRTWSVALPGPEIVRVKVTTVPSQTTYEGVYLVKRLNGTDAVGDEFPVFSDKDLAPDDVLDVYKPTGGTGETYGPDDVLWKAFQAGEGAPPVKRYKVTAAGLLTCDVNEWDGTTLTGPGYVMVNSQGHDVGDVVYGVEVANGIEGHSMTVRPVLELLTLTPNANQYMVPQVVDGLGRLGYDYVRAH